MSRKDSFDTGGEEHHWIPLHPIVRDEMIKASQDSKEYAEETARRSQTPVNLKNAAEIKAHLVSAHQFGMDDVHYYDESIHDAIPGVGNRPRNWKSETVPELDHTDLNNWHSHEHEGSEYASDYPHTTMGNSHFHH